MTLVMVDSCVRRLPGGRVVPDNGVEIRRIRGGEPMPNARTAATRTGRLGLALAVLLTSVIVFVTARPADAATTKDPVILVAGLTTGPILEPAYHPLRDRLRNAGYSVDIVTYPDFGTGDIRVNAARLAQKVDEVRARTGAAKVDLVGHSMGGLVSRYYVKSLAGASKVDTIITLGTPNYGTAIATVATFFGFGSCVGVVSCQQMATGSSFLTSLNAGDDSIGTVRYVNIATRLDELVIPYTRAFLTAADGNIANIDVQAQCPLRVPMHGGLIFDGAVADGVKDALRGEPVRMNCWAL
jgi:triacylglycerol lipase